MTKHPFRALREEEIPTQVVELPSARKRRTERADRFLLVDWPRLVALMQLAGTPGPFRLMMALLLQEKLGSVRTKDGWIEPRLSVLEDIGVAGPNYTHTLAALEDRGVIEVRRRRGKRALVRFVK